MHGYHFADYIYIYSNAFPWKKIFEFGFTEVCPLLPNCGNKSCNQCWISNFWMHQCALQWHHNGRGGVSNHQPRDCLLNRLFRRRSKKTLKLCVTGLCAWNSPVTGEFPAQMASNAENVSIWWRHHGLCYYWSTRWSRAKSLPIPMMITFEDILQSGYDFARVPISDLSWNVEICDLMGSW